MARSNRNGNRVKRPDFMALALQEAEARGDESAPEAFEATMEPEEAAPEEAAMHVIPEPEAGEGQEDEDVSLESIVQELKRREGRS